MRVLTNENNKLACYAMVMDRTIEELSYLIRSDEEYDLIATTLGYAPVHFSVGLGIDRIIKYSWPHRMIIISTDNMVAYDPTIEYFNDPKHGLRPVTQLPTPISIITFYWYRHQYND